MSYSPASIVNRPLTAATVAVVRVTFIPTLSDELSITPGETLRIIGSFDDGWAMCVNGRGDRGMVPLECLEGGSGQFRGYQEQAMAIPTPVMSARRVSSLYPLSARPLPSGWGA